MAEEGALRFSHGHLSAVLASPTSVLIALDARGVILVWNSGAEKSFGIAEDAIVGQAFMRCPIAWDWERVEALVPGGVARTERRLTMEFERPDRSRGRIAFQVKPQFKAGTAFNGCLWLGSDTGGSAARLAPDTQTRHARPRPNVPVMPATEALHRYPVHIAFLDSHLVARGEDPARWTIVAAEETRLDDLGMEVSFTLVRSVPAPSRMRRRVLVARGELLSIRDG